MNQPLAGVRVADLSHALAGPFCTQQLQLLGADVIKIEPPGSGDDFRERPAVFAAINAGKRSVVLDLKTASGLDAFHRLVAGSDVVVENYRPGVTETKSWTNHFPCPLRRPGTSWRWASNVHSFRFRVIDANVYTDTWRG